MHRQPYRGGSDGILWLFDEDPLGRFVVMGKLQLKTAILMLEVSLKLRKVQVWKRCPFWKGSIDARMRINDGVDIVRSSWTLSLHGLEHSCRLSILDFHFHAVAL